MKGISLAQPFTEFVPTPAAVANDESLTLRTSWLVAGKTLAFAFTVAIPMLLVRRMPQHEFGLYKQIFLVINSAVTMLPVGVGMTAYYFLPRYERHRPHAIFNIVAFTSGVSALFGVVLALFPAMLVQLFHEPTAVAYAPWIAVVVVLWSLGSLLEIVTIANQEVRVGTAAIAGMQMSRAAFFLIGAIVAGTVRAILAAAICHGIVQVIALWVYLRSRFPEFWRSLDWAFLKAQLAYAVPFGIAGFLYSLQTDLHNYFVSHRFGPATYALYSVGCFQLPFFGILADSVAGVLLPRVTIFQRDGRARDILDLMARAMRKLALVYFPAYAYLIVVRREFITAVFTTQYLDSVPLFALNLTLIPLGIFLSDPVIRAHAEHRHFPLKLHAALIACLVATLPVAIARAGLLGAIADVVVIQSISRLAGMIKIGQILGVGWDDVRLIYPLGRTAAAAIAAGFVTVIVRAGAARLGAIPDLIACAAAFAIVYVAGLVAFGAVTVEERAFVLDRAARVAERLRPRQAAAVAVGE